MNTRSKKLHILTLSTENSPKMSTAIGPSDTLSLSYFIMLPVIADPVSQQSKKKEKVTLIPGKIQY